MSTELASEEPRQRNQQEKGLVEASPLSSGVSAKFDNGSLTLTGPLGKVRQDFSRIPVSVVVEADSIVIRTRASRRRDRSIVKTAVSLVNNGILGVTKGYQYKLKVVFAHFPVSVKVQGKKVFVENFYGERSPRVAEIVGDTKVDVSGEDVVVTGVSAQDAGQTAANIEQATTVRRKDQRVFLDGVYVYERNRGKS